MPHKRTQKKHKKSHRGGRIHGMNFVPGRVYYFDENNTNELDGLMQSNVPMMIRHHSKDCTYCKKFEEPWSQIEDVTKKYPQSYSVASMDPYATEKCMKKYRDYPRINGVPAVILVNQDGVPIEHTGPNTFEGLQAFLEKNGLEIVKKTEDNNTYSDAGLGTSASAESIGAAGLGAAGLGAAGLGAGAAGLGAGSIGAESIGTSDNTAESIGTESNSVESNSVESNSVESNSVESIGAAEPKSVLSNVKETVSKIDDGIKQGISKLTEPIDFKNLFGFKSDTENAADKASANNNAVANAVANANAFPEMPDELKDEQQGNQQQQQQQQPQGNQPPPPQLPSVGGKSKKNKNKTKKGKKSRRKTKRRQHRSRK